MTEPTADREELLGHLESIERALETCPIKSMGLQQSAERIIEQLKKLDSPQPTPVGESP